jgi:hypothetical protein
VSAGADLEVQVRCRNAEVVEERRGEGVIVVLSRMDDALREPASLGCTEYWSQLGKVGAGADDVQEFHH